MRIEACVNLMRCFGLLFVSGAVGLLACKDTSQPTAIPIRLAISPSTDTLLPNVTLVLSYTAHDQSGKPVTPVGDTRWTSSDTSVARVSQSGVVRGGRSGVAKIELRISRDTASASVWVVPHPTLPIAGATSRGKVVVPSVIDTAAVYVLTVVGGAVGITASGSFEVPVSQASPSVVFAMQGSSMFGLAVHALGNSPDTGLRIDARSTAVALVYLTPTVVAAPAAITSQLLGLH